MPLGRHGEVGLFAPAVGSSLQIKSVSDLNLCVKSMRWAHTGRSNLLCQHIWQLSALDQVGGHEARLTFITCIEHLQYTLHPDGLDSVLGGGRDGSRPRDTTLRIDSESFALVLLSLVLFYLLSLGGVLDVRPEGPHINLSEVEVGLDSGEVVRGKGCILCELRQAALTLPTPVPYAVLTPGCSAVMSHPGHRVSHLPQRLLDTRQRRSGRSDTSCL